jgi:hypothetical protein
METGLALVGLGAQLVDDSLSMAYGVTSTALLLAIGTNSVGTPAILTNLRTLLRSDCIDAGDSVRYSVHAVWRPPSCTRPSSTAGTARRSAGSSPRRRPWRVFVSGTGQLPGQPLQAVPDQAPVVVIAEVGEPGLGPSQVLAGAVVVAELVVALAQVEMQ